MNKSAIKKLLIFIVALVLIIVATILLVNFVDKKTQPQPEEVIVQFEDSFNNQDLDSMIDCFEPEFQSKYDELKAIASSLLGLDDDDIISAIPFLSSLKEKINSSDKALKIEIVVNSYTYSEDKTQATAYCTVSLSGDTTVSEDVEIPLVKVDSKWYISKTLISSLIQ